MPTSLSLIVAASDNDVIGGSGHLPWKLPADMLHFKQLTMGHPIIMGRKTFESIGKPLSGRTNIVITRQKGFQACGATVVRSLEEALQICEEQDEVFVIGGAEIYSLALPLANKIYLTRINQGFLGDAFLFKIDSAVWKETAREDFPPQGNNLYPYSFLTYERR